jgi:RND family efflux transporter MFP subunit
MRPIPLSPPGRQRKEKERMAGWAKGAFPILSLLLLFSCSSGKKPEQGPREIPVVVGKVRHIDDFQTVPVSGSVVSPDAPAGVSFLVSGRVIQVGPREGEYVDKGRLLASIDPADYRLAVDASAAQSEAARVAFQRAGDEYERMKFLYETKSLAPNDFQKYKAAFEGARQQVEQAIAGERISRKRLSDAILCAPVGGFITKRSIEPGEMASAGRPVFEISRLDPVEIATGVPETDIGLVKIGQKVGITLPALPGHSFKGVVKVLNVSADPSTRTYMTRIAVPNPGHILKLGMVAEAKIRSHNKINIITLSGDAVVRDPQGVTSVFVYYPDQRRVYAKRVEIGSVYDTDVEVKSGLTGNELIVVGAQDKLRDGVPVSVKTGAADKTYAAPGRN